ncbi:MAG: hypothetical protein QHH30_11210 [candidate division NC10 bacterium]|nr:hypothetical protein [candidate division NC10 bacterium]
MRKYMAITMLCALSLSLWGCMQKTYTAAPPEGAEPTPLPPAYRFEDLPVPATMSLVRAESYIFEAGTLRAAIMVYEGKDDPSELVKYYRDNMPQHQWKLVSVFESQEARLTFRKPGWSCSISIAKKAMQPTRLVILIGPEGEKA